MGGPSVRAGADLFEAAGIPTADTPDEAIQALMHLIHYTRGQRMLYETPRELPLSFPAERHQLRDKLLPLLHHGEHILSESDAKRFLSAYGIAISLATTMIFLLMIQLTRAIGGKGVIPPDYAAWIPGAIFGLMGIVLLIRVRT